MGNDVIRMVLPINGTGYGLVGLSIVRALHERDVKFELLPIGNIDYISQEILGNKSFHESLYTSLNHRKVNKENNLDQFIFWHIPHGLEYITSNSKNILYSTFETYPVQHFPRFQQPLENVIFSSTNSYAIATLKNAHNCNVYNNPIPHGFWFKDNKSIWPNGVDHLLTNKSIDNINKYWENITGIVFETVLSLCGKAEERKSTAETLTAFTLCFRKINGNHLLLAACNNPFYPKKLENLLAQLQYIPEKILEVGTLYKRKNKYILVFNRLDTRIKLYNYLTNSHFFLSFSKGEGWNLPLTDMLSLGVPCSIGKIPCYTDWLQKTKNVKKKIEYSNQLSPAKDEMFFNGTCGWHTTSNLALDITNNLDSLDFNQINNESREIETLFNWDNVVDSILTCIK